MTDEGAIDRRATGQWIDALAGESGADRARTEARMHPSHLQHLRLELWRHLVRTGVGAVTAIGEARESFLRVDVQPSVDRLATDSIATGHVGDTRCLLEHLEHGLIPLFHEPQLHQHDNPLVRPGRSRPRRRRLLKMRGLSVAHQPEPVSPLYRSRVRNVKSLYPCSEVAPVGVFHSRRGSRSIDAARPSTGIGEGAVLS